MVSHAGVNFITNGLERAVQYRCTCGADDYATTDDETVDIKDVEREAYKKWREHVRDAEAESASDDATFTQAAE